MLMSDGSRLARLTTRERILYEAAALFARQGYHGTTTREIAEAVGVRQPSLFHHFRSKKSIVEAILDWDLDIALPRVRAIAARSDSAAVRLFMYLHADVTHLASAPYNLSGVYTEEVIAASDFAPWASRRDELHDIVEGIVREGMASDEFVHMDSNIIRHALGGILVRVLTIHSGGRGTIDALAENIARLMVRAVLVDPTQLEAVALRAIAPAG
ncbi:MAG: TetR/AcrR family transcriptional regulator [Chloroflexota bacterium]|nr:TetR/AcrR family transcriptional regulator [Chloroflexota bacterium]